MISINVKADVSALKRQLDAFARKQLPFATAQALTAVARKAADAERTAMAAALDRPEPFTLRGIAVQAARKDKPVAWVYIKPIQAHYLGPSILGGPQVLNQNRGVLDPVNVKLDAFGNIPRRLLARLKGRRDVFIGTVKGINGVWQRSKRHGLKLLIRFTDPKQLPARYAFGAATRQIAAREFPAELRRQLVKAMATAR